MVAGLVALIVTGTGSQASAQEIYPTPAASSMWPYPSAQIVGHITAIPNTDFLPNLGEYYADSLPTAVELLSDSSWSTGVRYLWEMGYPDPTLHLLEGHLAGGPFFAGKHSILVVGTGNTLNYPFGVTLARLILSDGTLTDWRSLRDSTRDNQRALVSNGRWYSYGFTDPERHINYPADGTATWFSVTPLHQLVQDGKEVVGIQLTKGVTGIGNGPAISFVGIIAHPRAASIRIFDSNRFGNASKGLPGATVRFIAGSSGVMGTAITDTNGYIDMTTLPAVNQSELYDVQIERPYEIQLENHQVKKGTWRRVFQSMRPKDAIAGGVQLVLPVTLQETLATALDKLRITGALSLDYEVDRAGQLSELRNRLVAESAEDHHTHDLGLARLLVATESMSRIYNAAEPLAKDAGKVLADSIISILAMKEAASEVETNAMAGLLTFTTSERAKAYVRATLSVWIKHAMTAQLKLLVGGAEQILPEWAADLVSQSNSDITAGILGAFVTSAWDKPGGRKQLLESLAALLSEQVGGKIMASAHVKQTQTDFDLAEIRARLDDGEGEPSAAFKASLGKAIDIETAIDLALAESELIGDTTAKFGQVADYAELAGKIPAAQIAAVMARLIKAINVGLTVRVVTREMSTLYDVAFTDTPAAADLAFFPAGHGTPAPLGIPQIQGGPDVVQQAYLKASNVESSDEFGTAVAISGDTLVVGVPNEDSAATGVNGNQGNGASNSGAAYVFVRNGSTWTQQAYLKASNTNGTDLFGTAVAISGDTIAIGARLEDSAATGVDGDHTNNTGTDSGAAYIFTRSGTTWTQQAYIKASNTGRSDDFGISLSLSGDTLVVGAPGEDSNATGVDGDQSNNLAGGSGAAYVFVRHGTVWNQQAYIKASDSGFGYGFGACVSVSDNTIAVGAYGAANSSGAAYVFTRDGENWSQQARLQGSNVEAGDLFGEKLALSEGTLVVSGRYEDSGTTGINSTPDETGYNSGAAYVFERSASGWEQKAYLKASNTQSSAEFGTSVAVASGNRIVVGAPFDGDSGTVYVFVRNRSGWSQQTLKKSSAPIFNDRFGGAVAASGDTAVAGAVLEDYGGTSSGAAYVFTGIGPVLSNNSALGELALSSGTLSPVFSSESTSYATGVGASISEIMVAPTAADASALIVVNGVPVASGSWSGAIPLAVGTNTIAIAVTAEDGLATKTYTVTVTRPVASSSLLTRLAEFRAAVTASDRDRALLAAESILSADRDLEVLMNIAEMQARARSAQSNSSDQALVVSLTRLRQSESVLHSALAEFYPATIGYFVPEMGDADMPDAKIGQLCDAVIEAFNDYETAKSSAQQAGSGTVTRPLLICTSHGLAGEKPTAAPGGVSVHARIYNAGDTAAVDVSAELIMPPYEGAVRPLVLSGAALKEIATIEPGESVDVFWPGVASDSSPEGIGSVAAYRLSLVSKGVPDRVELGSFRVLSEHQSYGQWLSSIGGMDRRSGFDEDFDGDGMTNGLEKLFGSDPTVPSGPALRMQSDGTGRFLEHSRSALFGSDSTSGYEWTDDLTSWIPSGGIKNGVQVTLNPIVSGGAGAEMKTIRVVPEVNGPANRLFFRLRADPVSGPAVNPAPVPPQITTQPVSLRLPAGQTGEFSVKISGTGPFIYQWRKNGEDIPGAIDPVLSIAPDTNSGAGVYSVLVVGSGGRVVSNEVTVTFE